MCFSFKQLKIFPTFKCLKLGLKSLVFVNYIKSKFPPPPGFAGNIIYPYIRCLDFIIT